MITDRIEPPRRGSPVKFSLPDIKTVADVVAAQAAITVAMSKGRLTPSEAMEVSAVVELARRAIETNEIETRIAQLERRIGSDDDQRALRNDSKAIEERISAKPGAAGTFRILQITGGLPGPINFAYAGEPPLGSQGGRGF